MGLGHSETESEMHREGLIDFDSGQPSSVTTVFGQRLDP